MASTARWLAAVLLAAQGAAAGASPAAWTAVTSKSEILVHVRKAGILSGLAHDHHFAASEWRASASLDPAAPGEARIEVVVAAGSLRDRQTALSPQDREKVDRQAAGPETLDADHFPEIRFVARGLPGPSAPGDAIDGEMRGTLSLHGRERPVAVPVHAIREGDGWRARGSVQLRQSDFGIAPFSGFLGTVSVHDEVVVEYDVVLAPAPREG